MFDAKSLKYHIDHATHPGLRRTVISYFEIKLINWRKDTKILNKSTVLPRLGTEVFSLTQDQIHSSEHQSTQFDLKLPNSLFINGIVLSHDNFSKCEKIEIGKMNSMHILTIMEVFDF